MAEQKLKLLTPVGRLINESLFEKSAYKDEKSGATGNPRYAIQMVFDPGELDEIEDAMVDEAVAMWGASAEADYDSGRLKSSISDGDEKAAAREAKGKRGDAYKGKIVLAAHTNFNANGQDAPGGVYVVDVDGSPLVFTNREKVFPGSFGRAVVTPVAWEFGGNKGVTLYLGGYQYSGPGEKLVSDPSGGLFTPLAPAEGAAGRTGRRGRGRG